MKRRDFLSRSSRTMFALGASTIALNDSLRASPPSEQVRIAADSGIDNPDIHSGCLGLFLDQ